MGRDEVHGNCRSPVRSLVYIRVKKMSSLHNAMTETSRNLLGGGRTRCTVKQEETEIGVATHLQCQASGTYEEEDIS